LVANQCWIRVVAAPARLALCRTRGGAGLKALAIYRPTRPWLRASPGLFRLLTAPGRPCPPPPLDLGDLAGRLSLPGAGLAAMRSGAPDRLIIGLATRKGLAAVAKVGPADDRGLVREAAMTTVAAGLGLPFLVPSVRFGEVWADRFAIAVDAIAGWFDAVPFDLDAAVTAAVAMHEAGIVHGDFAPWNTAMLDGRPVVIDWEDARRGIEPMEDLVHFVVRSEALLGSGDPAVVRRSLVGPSSPGARFLAAVGHDPASGEDLVRDYASRHRDDFAQSGALCRRLLTT
jgi:hypothetical protein